MDDKRRSKRSKIADTEGFWDCSVCTFKNPPEAFKCDMCDVRKGTSTRKPQINAQLVAQQVATQQFALPPLKKDKKKTPTSSSSTSPQAQILPGPSPTSSSSSSSSISSSAGKKAAKLKEIKSSSTPASSKPKRPLRLKNIDRSTAFSMEVTVNDVTVIITDYKPKKEKDKKDKGDTPGAGSSALSSPTLSPSASSATSLSPSPSMTSSTSVLSPVTSSMTSSAADNQNNNVTGLPTSSDSPRGSSAYSVDNLLNSSNSSSTGGSSSTEYNKQDNDDVEMKDNNRD